MNIKKTILAVFAAAIALAGRAGGVDDEIKALQRVINSNSVDRTVDCRWYRAWYIDQCTKEEREAILERNIAAHRRWIELLGGSGTPRAAQAQASLGKVLAVGGRWEEAERELSAAVAHKFHAYHLADARWALAECLWRRKDKEGAKRQIAEIAAMTWDKHPPASWSKARYLHRAWTDPDGDLDAFKLPHSVDGKPFPVPQEAKYGEKKVSLARVELKVKGLRDERGVRGEGDADPIIRLLKRKLARFGSTFAPGGTPIRIELSPDAPVDKPQGYSIDVAKGKVVVKARTRLGLTYGVVSLIQCVDRGELDVCEMSIRDWPRCEKRGVIAYWAPGYLEYALFGKMSSLLSRIMMPKQDYGFLFSPLERERCRIVVRRYLDFGIEFYWGERQLVVEPLHPMSSPRTRAMYLSCWRFAAAIGAGVCFHMDDTRFPLRPEDAKAAGTAANLDAKFLDGLFKEVKEEFPDFKLTFGPPFYFGPDGGLRKDWYPEPRDPYLKSVGDFLDPRVDVYWTGPRVKSYSFPPAKAKWYSDLVGRKPVIFHNSDCIGRHNFYSYGADVPGYKSHCPEFFDLVAGFYQNTSRYEESCFTYPSMDWSWNPDGHDDEVAARRAIEQLEGPGVFDIIAAATPSLSYFDKYALGRPRSELFAEDQADLDRRVADAEKAWSNALAIAKNNGTFVKGFSNLGIKWAKQLAEYRRNPPDWLVKQRDAELANTKFAVKEVGYDEAKGDQFIPSELMQGGTYVARESDWANREPCGVKYIGVGKEIAMDFKCDLFPPERPPKLFVIGKSSDHRVFPAIEIVVNGRVVWSGEAFASRYFKPLEIELPVDALKHSNRLVLRNTAPSTQSQRMPEIHYAVIRR